MNTSFSDLLAIGYFPKFKGIVTAHYKRRTREILAKDEELRNKLKSPHEILHPDRPDIWEAAGFIVRRGAVIASGKYFRNYSLYHFDEYERYQAYSFAHQIQAVFVPLMELHAYLEHQAEIDETDGKWYYRIFLREGDDFYRNFQSSDSSIGMLHEDAETLLLWLERGGSGQTIRERPSFDYVQVCYVVEM